MATSLVEAPPAPAPVILPRQGVSPPTVSEIGGKGRSLWRLRDLGVETPPWIVIPICVFQELVMRGRPWPASETHAERLSCECLRLDIPAEFRKVLSETLREAGLAPGRVAVRSSAAAEDGSAASFAGQFDSVLNVPAEEEELFDAIRRVWSSAFSVRARAYGSSSPMAVIVQSMVEPAASGVAFSADPVSGERDIAVISATPGLGERLVSGQVTADTWRVRNCADIASREIVSDSETACLTDEQVREVAAAANALADSLGSPQDVEWSFGEAGGRRGLWILQTRPITALPPPRPSGERRVWDNSNIIESYAGVTTPLTFSFARGVYEEVYRQFCRLMGVSEALLEAHRPVFAEMLGLINGRVYYNLLNWYRALALLPGYSVNRAFMERMMGVRQKLADPPDAPYVAGKFEDSLRLAGMAVRLLSLQRNLPRDVDRFHRRIDAALGPLAGEDLSQRTPDELLALYRRLEEDLLRQWQTPLVNDFLTMITFGILGRMIEKWLPDLPSSIVNDLLCGEGSIISAEPARRVAELSRQAGSSTEVMRLLAAEADDHRVWQRLVGDSRYLPFRKEVARYLEEFGDRCANELKLETVTLSEDPAFLIRMIRQGALHPADRPAGAPEQRLRQQAEAQIDQRLSGVRRALFRRTLRATRARVRDRENLRFERTRVFGVVRRIFLALGERLASVGMLESARDVFWLTQEELFGHLTGTGGGTDLRGLVTLRQAEFARYREMTAPPDRFETFGPPALSVPRVPALQANEGDLQGVACCPGIVRGRVAIVREPQQAPDLTGRILVAERTDPGWTLLFPAAAGLLVQRGSLLSHSAIVARETGLPCIVAIAGLMETLRDGERVEMDGTTGVVRRLAG